VEGAAEAVGSISMDMVRAAEDGRGRRSVGKLFGDVERLIVVMREVQGNIDGTLQSAALPSSALQHPRRPLLGAQSKQSCFGAARAAPIAEHCTFSSANDQEHSSHPARPPCTTPSPPLALPLELKRQQLHQLFNQQRFVQECLLWCSSGGRTVSIGLSASPSNRIHLEQARTRIARRQLTFGF
jgi:hypothetical protein